MSPWRYVIGQQGKRGLKSHEAHRSISSYLNNMPIKCQMHLQYSAQEYFYTQFHDFVSFSSVNQPCPCLNDLRQWFFLNLQGQQQSTRSVFCLGPHDYLWEFSMVDSESCNFNSPFSDKVILLKLIIELDSIWRLQRCMNTREKAYDQKVILTDRWLKRKS